MKTEYFDDETLMAFADGELDEETSLRIEAALESDEVLVERLAVFLDTRSALATAMKPLIAEPVPPALAASVARMAEDAERAAAGTADDNVVAFRSREKPPVEITRRHWLMPMAASILAVVTGVGGFMAGRGSVEPDRSFAGAVATALDREPSGSDVALGGTGEVLHLVSSFTDGRGDLCREYELRRQDKNTATVACRTDGQWVTRLALSAPRAEGYVPASSQETIDAYLATIDASEPLAAEDEKAALSRTGR